MSLLDEMLAKPVDRVVFKPGFAGTFPNVIIGGQSVAAFWLDGVYTKSGTPVWVAVYQFKDAPATYVVAGTFTGSYPREGTVTAAPGGSPTITVTVGSTAYTATFLSSYTPTVNDAVRLFWQGPDVTVLGKVGATPTPAIPGGGTTAPPVAAPTSGQLNAPATDSATWSSGYGWNSYYGNDVYQGNGTSWGASSINNGAWFYGGITTQLAGLTITRVQFKVPPRLNAGATSSGVTMHLYTHSNNARPAGDVTRTTGPNDINITAGSAGGWVDLPTSVGTTLASGGGMGLTGDPYAGWEGLGRTADSGQLLIDWHT